MNLTKTEREGVRANSAGPGQVAMRVVKTPWKHPTLMETGELASEVKRWKRISRPKEHIYSGSTKDGLSIAVTVLTTSPPKYVTFLSHESQPGFRTFTTQTDHPEAEIPEKIINTAVINILRNRDES
jgi:hypothetical protein